ncbi:MAG TPA: PLP-dependent aminotransferase family protein [Trebonia sp.]|jgi:DNA-binding transcriptional MocR family regulator|nr:PLP-dependent aminotransferase family protein [Trebonia sp.]
MTVPINAGVARIGGSALADLLGRWSAADGPLYRLLASRIARLADTAALPAGLRLPPERDLAAALSVSRNTVALAYQLLRDDGMAESRQGSGTRITPHRTTPGAVHRSNAFFTGMLEQSAVSHDLTIAAVECAPQVAAALADPVTVLSSSERALVTRGLGYYPYGWPALRGAIADLLTHRHGIPTSAEQVLVTSGAQQALDLLIRCEVLPGQAVAAEDPTFPGALDIMQRAGARPVGVPPGDADRLARVLRLHAPAAAYLIPTYQNPTGLTVPEPVRHEIAGLAARYPDVTFIDDMVLTGLALSDAQEPPPLAALAPVRPNVVSIGSLSKTYWGGLRTGWIRAPEGIIARLAAAKAAADLGSPAYQQAVVAALITRHHEEILKWRLDWLRPRYTALTRALRARLPGWSWAAPSGGLTIWAQAPGEDDPAADSSVLAQSALRRGVAVLPGRLASVDGRAGPYVRLAFTLPPDQLTAAVGLIAEAV